MVKQFRAAKQWLRPFVRKYSPTLLVPVFITAHDSILWLRAQRHRVMVGGSGLVCDFCGFRSDSFLEDGIDEPVLVKYQVVGGGRRANSTCPSCGSSDRERLVRLGIDLFVALPESAAVLHVAPERRLNRFLRGLPRAVVTECDLDPARYEWTTQIVREDLTKLSFADNSFDLVVCNHVLEHIPDDRKAMSEIYRVTKQGGTAILQVPYSTVLPETDEDLNINDPEHQLRRFGQDDHVRIYNLSDYIRRAESVGFQSRFITPEEFVPHRDHAIAPNEGLLIFRRPDTNPASSTTR